MTSPGIVPVSDDEAGAVEVKPRRSCNRHVDCDAHDAKPDANPFTDHCNDECCEDCFGN